MKNIELPEPKVYPRSSHSISRKAVDSHALSVMYRLVRQGYKAYLVGGGVRDLLLGRKPKDFDVVTDATPREVKSIFRNCRIIGRRFKLAHVFFPENHIIEVATFRDVAEAEVDGDEDAVADQNKFGTEFTDAFRRDITINALFYDVSRFAIIDYVGGMEDLRQKLIRVIGKPDVRYKEDPVRMIRVLRYAARAGFSVEEESFKAILTGGSLLEGASKMRLFEEYKKELVSGYLAAVVPLWRAANVERFIAPELKTVGGIGFVSGGVLEAIGRFDASVRECEFVSTGTSIGFLVFLGARARGEIDALQVLDAENYNRYFMELGVHRQIPFRDRLEAQAIVEVLIGRPRRSSFDTQIEVGVRQCGGWLQMDVESLLDDALVIPNDEKPKRKRRRRRGWKKASTSGAAA